MIVLQSTEFPDSTYVRFRMGKSANAGVTSAFSQPVPGPRADGFCGRLKDAKSKEVA